MLRRRSPAADERARGEHLGFLACAGLLAYAYYAQFVMHLEPCPLCIFQRIGVLAIGIAFALAAAHDPGSPAGASMRRSSRSLPSRPSGLLPGICTFKNAPPGSIPSCGASLDFMLKVFPLTDVLVKVLTGSGECAKVTWRFSPRHAGLGAHRRVVLGAWGLWSNLRRRPPVLKF